MFDNISWVQHADPLAEVQVDVGMRTVNLLCAMALLAFSSAAGLTDVYQCGDPLFSARATTDELAEAVCIAAIEAKELLVSCGLTQTQAINIEVVDIAQHPSFGNCMALFDQQTGCIQVTDIQRLPSLIPAGDPRSALPPEVLFSAAIAHELAHALLQQTAGSIEIAATEQEFVANAFEMQSLDPKWRDLLLQANPVKPPGSLGLVHLGIYALDPRIFANNAWMVFDQEVMGCSLVRNIAQGNFRFPRH